MACLQAPLHSALFFSESNVESEGKNKRDEPETSLNIAHESTLKEKRQLDNNSQKSSEQKTDSPSVKKKHKAEKYSFTEKGTGVFVNVGLREQAVTQGVHKTADALVLTGDSSKKVNRMTATTSKIKDHERTEKSEHKTEKKLHQVAVGKVEKKRNKKKKKKYQPDHISSDRLKAYDIDPRKFKYTKHLILKKSVA